MSIFYKNVSKELPIQHYNSKKDTPCLSMLIISHMEEQKAENYVMSDASLEELLIQNIKELFDEYLMKKYQ